MAPLFREPALISSLPPLYLRRPHTASTQVAGRLGPDTAGEGAAMICAQTAIHNECGKPMYAVAGVELRTLA